MANDLHYDEEDPPLVNIAKGLHSIAKAIHRLSYGGDTPGGCEGIGMMLRDGLSGIAEAIHHHGGDAE